MAQGRDLRTGLTAEEFTARFQSGTRVLWTLAAGLLGDPAEAEDVCQEAFLAAYDKRDQFAPGTDFMAWMGRFVRNMAANEVRKRARRQTTSADPLVLDESHPFPGAGTRPAPGPGLHQGDLDGGGVFNPDEFEDRVLAGLRELGEVPRACLLLRTLRELGYAEIASLLAIPEGTAMSHVHRARLALRAKLDPTFDGARP
jgi:RNA polymerase sigma-70 factor (ECF subfamily)